MNNLIKVMCKSLYNWSQPEYRYYLVYYWSHDGWSEIINAIQFDSKVPLGEASKLISNYFRSPSIKSVEDLSIIRTDDYLVGKSSKDYYYRKPSSLGQYTSETLPQRYEVIKYFKGYCTEIKNDE